jgi:hypothetical protein
LGQKITTSTGPHGTTAINPPITVQQKVKVVMQVVVSLMLLIVGILILTSPHRIFNHAFDEGTKRWAAGWIGAVIGYWFS